MIKCKFCGHNGQFRYNSEFKNLNGWLGIFMTPTLVITSVCVECKECHFRTREHKTEEQAQKEFTQRLGGI
jgi:hypothetical protein